MLRSLRLRFRSLFDRSAMERDLSDEVRFHIEHQAATYVRQGMTPDAALRRARVEFGSVENAKEEHRDERGTRSLQDTLGDVRYAVRSLWRDRALAFAGVITLALGIGATTAVFSAVNEVMLRELPFTQPGQLVQVWEENPDRNWYKNVVAPANYLDWKSRVGAFADAAAYFDYLGTTTLLGQGEPQLLSITSVTGNFLSVLGVRPALGRGFTPADDWDDGQRPLMVSNRVFRTVFRGDSTVVGRNVSLNGRPWQLVGVLPEGFILPTPNVDVFAPMLWNRQSPQQIFFRRAHNLRVVARLKPGVSLEQANASLQTVVKQLQAEYPQTNTRMGAGITPMREWIVGDTKRPLIVLLAAAAVLLLIACANVGNLLLVHALGRSRDVALRFVLGASRGRVARQALTESLVLSIAGGIAGSALGWAGAKALLAMQPDGMLPVTEISLDYRVLGFAILLVTVSGIAFGLAPALMTTRLAPADALSSSSRSVTGGHVRRWGRRLVVAEVALAVILMVGAGLLLRSYQRLSSVNPGFDATGVMTASVIVPTSRYDTSTKVIGFYHTLLERVAALPGVQSVGATRELPVTQVSWSANLGVKGQPPFEKDANILYREVLGDYFATMRVPVRAGRVFTQADEQTPRPVAVVNEALVRQYFPTVDPVGQLISMDRVPDSTTTWYEILGVVGSEHQATLAEPARPEVYLTGSLNWTRRMTLVARAKPGLDAMTLAQPIRKTVRDLDSLMAIVSLRPMTEVQSQAMSRQRFISVLILVFALTGVALALVGVFGILAQLVQARWRELGIRMALGAQRSTVRWMVARNGLALLAAGIAAGLAIALAATRVMTSLLFEVQPTDALTYVGVGLVVALAGLLAALIPAWRASTANPAGTLRAE